MLEAGRMRGIFALSAMLNQQLSSPPFFGCLRSNNAASPWVRYLSKRRVNSDER